MKLCRLILPHLCFTGNFSESLLIFESLSWKQWERNFLTTLHLCFQILLLQNGNHVTWRNRQYSELVDSQLNGDGRGAKFIWGMFGSAQKVLGSLGMPLLHSHVNWRWVFMSHDVTVKSFLGFCCIEFSIFNIFLSWIFALPLFVCTWHTCWG